MSITAASPQYKNLRAAVWALAVVLPVVVAVLFQVRIHIDYPFSVYTLPLINAILNATTTVLLLGALYFAKQRRITQHTRLIYTAMVTSVLFLLVYVLYHISTEHTSYGGEGIARTIYFVLLISHIALAVVQTPFVLFAFLYGYTGQIEKHRRIVKWSFPIWLYVSVTGVVCYLMISPYYAS